MGFCDSWTEFAIVGKSGLRYLEIFGLVASNALLKLVLCLEKSLLLLFAFGGSQFRVGADSKWLVQFRSDIG